MSRLLALMTVLLCYLMLRVSSERMKGQYCHANTAEEPVAFCVTASTWYNESTQATDLALIFGHQRSPRGGWAAVGLGEGMFGALMFITYAQASPGNSKIPFWMRWRLKMINQGKPSKNSLLALELGSKSAYLCWLLLLLFRGLMRMLEDTSNQDLPIRCQR